MGRRGFTLIELMIATAIIGILGSIAIPQCAQLVRKAQEADTKGNLASLRSALAIYYGDNETFPHDMASLEIGGKYIGGIPNANYPPYHTSGNDIASGNTAAFLTSFTDTAHWWYFDETDNNWGTVIANCTHADAKGVDWTTY